MPVPAVLPVAVPVSPLSDGLQGNEEAEYAELAPLAPEVDSDQDSADGFDRVRTNNDLFEGWNRQFNIYMGARSPLYSFASKVAQEADATRDKIVAKDFQRRSCEATTQRERRLENITEKYFRREITASTMLDHVANVYGY